MEHSPTHRITPTSEHSLKRRRNNQELKDKVDLLEERKNKLSDSFYGLEKIAQNEELKFFGEAICECLSILGTSREDRSTVWKFLDIIHFFQWEVPRLRQTYQPIVDSLNHFVVTHEDWQKVEAYAKEDTIETVDFELHEMAVWAWKIVCRIERKPFEIKLQALQTCGQFIVSNRRNHYHNYSSAFGLTQGIHFFETVVLVCSNYLPNPKVQVGWNTRRWIEGERHRIDEENLLQYTYDPIDDHQFIGFDGSYPSGTVLGCLINITQRTFAFYVNGQKVVEKLQQNIPFSSNAYYVHAKGDLLYCNFGQVPFKYPPTELLSACPATDLATDLANQIKRYTLYEEVYLMPLFDNRVEPYFTDEKQGKVKKTLEQLLKKGEITKENVEKMFAQLWKEETFREETYCSRWLQAIIEMENVAEGRINDLAILVERMVNLMNEEWYCFVEILEPYSKLRETEDSKSTMCRTLVILFAILLQYNMEYDIWFNFSLYSFLLSAFLTTTNHITAMFTLIGLETVKEEEENEEKMQELRSKEFTEKLTEWKRIIENTRKMNHSLAQLHLVIQYFEYSLLSSSVPPPASATPTSLSPSRCSSKAKLSLDCLSLRSDFKWQSACSHFSVDNSLSLAFPFFYFEATLLTSGPMRIGWATQRWQVENNKKLGGNEYSFGYDGNTGCIWNKGVQWRVKNAKRWQANDVIGCLLDLANKQFTFYQNGERIQTNGDIYSRVSKKIEFLNKEKIVHVYERNDSLKLIRPFISMHPYHAALSLGPYQQVTVNFGHTFFRFPPKCLDFWDFQQYSEYLEVHGPNKRVKSVNISSATNSIISIQGKTTTGDFSVNPSAVSTKPTTKSTFIILEPTVCQVCKQKTNLRRRTLEGCPHLAFCVDCSSKNLFCKECPQ